MQGSDPNRVTARSEATGSWRPRPDAPPAGAESDNAPTVRRSGSGSGRERVAPVPVALPRSGETLGEYELLETIGVGGMGAVFRGVDHGLERNAAIKVLPKLPDQEGDPEDVQRFHQEARAAARLDHDGIARVFGLGYDRGFHFIAFEFIEGNNLRHLVEDNGPLTAHDAILYSLQVAAALVHAAERGVVHRDVKPSNIIITPQGRAKLVDMGLARRFERERSDGGLTQSGTTLGSFDYISPEQARDPRDVDVRSDLYSLGCTMYHMLTGKPPFADGTVLQKLLQHQEEPPPNVRDANPAVPSGLSATISKLMAKDRNRRYQSPEQLGHDLLALAADLGLRLPGFDFSGRAAAEEVRRWWRKPTLWAGAAAALMTVPLIASLSWIARDRVAIASLEKELLAASMASRMTAPIEEPTGNGEDAASEPPKLFRITNDIELATALAQASSNSTLELVGDGPFEIRRAQPVLNRDLMLKAGPSSRPVLRLGRGPNRRNGEPILHFIGGHLILEGLLFDLETSNREDTATALVAEDVDLEIRRCTFRRGPQWWNPGWGVALDLRSKLGAQLSPPSLIQSSSFEGTLTAILGRGALDLRISDCLFGLNSSVVRLERGGLEQALPGKINLQRVSVLAGDGPIFRLAGMPPRIKVDNSVFGPSDDRPLTLVAADEPDRLNWSGRENLYARVGSFLQAASNDSTFSPIRRFNTWADDSPLREVGSMTTETAVWADSRPTHLLIVEHEPERAFRLAPMEQGSPEVGARQGPNEAIPAPTLVATRKPTPPPVKPDEPPDAEPKPTVIAEVGPPPPAEPATPNPPELARAEVGPPRAAAGGSVEPAEPTHPRPTPMVRPGGEALVEEPVPIQTQQEFLDEIHRLGPRGGGTLVLAANSVLSLPTQEFRSAGQWKIKAAANPGENRPLIRFVPVAGEVKSRSQNSWHTLFRLRDKASLILEGVDVVLPEVNTILQGDRPWAAFGVSPGTELELVQCTVTVEGRTSPISAAIAVRSWDDNGDREVETTAAKVRVDDCLIRASGDLANVGSGRRLTLNLRNTAIAAGGVMVRGSGAERVRNSESPTLKLALHKVTCWTSAGLISLKANAGETELPTVEVAARETIFALTNNSNSFIRIDGQEDPDNADPIRWDGQRVAYQGIEIYRQEAYFGEVPSKQYRPAWQDSQKLRDTAPIFDEVRFADPVRPNQSTWTVTRDQFRLDDESRDRKVGADPDGIPPPPSSN